MFRVGDASDGRSVSWSGLDLDLDLDLGLDLDVDAPRGRDELCFDEDTETTGGSQEPELGDDMFFSDDDGFIDETDLLSADEMDCTLDGAVDDFDDLWTSSQSTLDVCGFSYPAITFDDRRPFYRTRLLSGRSMHWDLPSRQALLSHPPILAPVCALEARTYFWLTMTMTTG